MQNKIEESLSSLLAQAEDAAGGAKRLENEIGLLQNKSPDIDAEKKAVANAVRDYEDARFELSARRETVRTLIETCRMTLTLARDIFKFTLGSEYSQAWEITGLAGSLALPKTFDGIQYLLSPFAAFLRTNPDHEFRAKGITATNFDSLRTQLETARDDAREQKMIVAQLLAGRDQKAATLRKRLRDLIAEIAMRIGPLDPRWKRFGFNMPGAEKAPDVPENVTAKVLPNKQIAVKWDQSPRSEYYRVWKRVIGVDAEPVAIGSPADLDFMFEDPPPNATLEIFISAINNGGESGLSKAITVGTSSSFS